MITTTAAGRTWRFSHALGRNTAEHNESKYGVTGGFSRPVSLALAPGGLIFVLSRGLGYGTFSPDAPDLYRRIGKTTIEEHHEGDFGRNDFTWPAGIAVSDDGDVFCSDEYENAISIFDPNSTLPFPEYGENGDRKGRWGETGAGPGQLNGPSGLAFDADNNLLVVDSRNDRVQRFTKEGQFLATWGSTGQGEGEFRRPWGITVDAAGDVYIADWSNNRVQKFTADGAYLMSFGTSPEEGGALDHPADVAVDSGGDVYVTDWANHRVQIYESSGDILTAIHGDAKNPTDSKAGEYVINRDPRTKLAFDVVEDLTPLGRFIRPTGVEVDEQDRVIIADSRGRLQIYSKLAGSAQPELTREFG